MALCLHPKSITPGARGVAARSHLYAKTANDRRRARPTTFLFSTQRFSALHQACTSPTLAYETVRFVRAVWDASAPDDADRSFGRGNSGGAAARKRVVVTLSLRRPAFAIDVLQEIRLQLFVIQVQRGQFLTRLGEGAEVGRERDAWQLAYYGISLH